MRIILAVAATLLFVPAASAGSGTALKITVWPKGKDGVSSTWTLRCGPPRGTHPDPAAACSALAQHPRALKPVPKDIACTQNWDGPQVALVRGTYRGKHVKAWFNRANGCEIGRWNALRPLFPIAD
jgi:hypothetical protein